MNAEEAILGILHGQKEMPEASIHLLLRILNLRDPDLFDWPTYGWEENDWGCTHSFATHIINRLIYQGRLERIMRKEESKMESLCRTGEAGPNSYIRGKGQLPNKAFQKALSGPRQIGLRGQIRLLHNMHSPLGTQ